jgi:pyruvate kinase
MMEAAVPRPKAVLSQRRTRIVATVGPASSAPPMLDALIRAGVNVFRLNMSHGDHATHRTTFENIRRAAGPRPIAVLADLCGPKIRVGRFPGGKIDLIPGTELIVTTRPDAVGGPGLIPSQYEPLARDVRPGDRILLDDGLLELRVESSDGVDVRCRVAVGGVLSDRKGMNLPGVPVSSPALTDKDRDDARFVLELGVDFLALSFVRRPNDVEDLRTLVHSLGQHTPIIAKIEKPEALDALDEILEASDGVMVARGDLGVELPPESVPIVQRELVMRARLKAKPVIVATQMLESMIHSSRPTRAEVSDVSHAVFSGADAVMLSAETASGEHPVAAVEMMDRVARQAESWLWTEGNFRSLTAEDWRERAELPLRAAVARSTAQLSRDLRVRAVVVRTRSGVSALMVAATRPAAPIVALAADPTVCRRMNLLWGVVPRRIGEEEFERDTETARREVKELGLAQEGQVILKLAGFGQSEPSITVLTV